MNTNTLPGIVGIHMVNCTDLQPNVMLAGICGMKIAIVAKATAVDFYGTPTLKWENSKSNGVYQEKSTLEFRSDIEIPDGERYAFVVTAANGKQYLIGSREPKYPVISYTETTGLPGGDAAVRVYKITHIAQKSVLPCVL